MAVPLWPLAPLDGKGLLEVVWVGLLEVELLF
jgi:hypothetical protein